MQEGGLKMKIEHLKIEKLGQISSIEINGEKAEKVLEQNISISAYGDSELNITLDISDALAEIETQDTEKEEKKITKFDAIKGMQNLKSIARSGYPLSLDLKQ